MNEQTQESIRKLRREHEQLPFDFASPALYCSLGFLLALIISL